MSDLSEENKITKETYNPKLHTAEYKRTCNECRKVWHSLVKREFQLATNLGVDFCGVCGTCGSPHQAQYSRNLDANNSSLVQLKKCPQCGSSNYTETVIYYEKNNNLLTNLAVWLIENLWEKRLGIYYNKRYKIICRFYPTCSEYAILALDQYGLVKGLSLAIVRIRRCTTYNTESCYDCP